MGDDSEGRSRKSESSSGTGSGGDSGGSSGSGSGSGSGSASGGSSSGSESEHRGGILGKAFERIVTVGLTGAFVAEESMRAYLGDMKLPKEVITHLIQGAVKSKEEIAGRITKEVVNMLSKVDIAKEASKFLETHKIKFSAEIEFTNKDKEKDKDRQPK